MSDYLPHTDAEVAEMLGFLGLGGLDELFSAVPAAVRLAGGLDLEPGRPEPDVVAEVQALAARNRPVGRDLVCFAGAGAYDHEVPAVVRALASRSEFVTAYTPYQAEVAQGVLQAVFEYQTMVSRLAGLPVANASLYDGASALVEAINLATAASGRQGVLVSDGVHPHWRAVARTLAAGTGHELAAMEPPTRRAHELAVPQGDGLVSAPSSWRSRTGSGPWRTCRPRGRSPTSSARCSSSPWTRSPPACCARRVRSGADVVVGEGQALGTRLSFGGPYLGLFACSREQVRRLPGRLVGETVDVDGTRGYVTTLRAREQDIRREKATSNVCTNQTLMAVTAAIQLSWLGPRGLHEVATRCAQGAHYCRDQLVAQPGVTAASTAPVPARVRRRDDRPGRHRPRAAGRRGVPGRGVRRDPRARPRARRGTARRARRRGRRHRAAHARRDRRVRRRVREGGAVTRARRRPGASSAPLLGRDAEPTIFELSVTGRTASSSGRPTCPRRRSTSSSTPASCARPPSGSPRSQSATSSGTSRASRTASSPSTSVPTRSGRAR